MLSRSKLLLTKQWAATLVLSHIHFTIWNYIIVIIDIERYTKQGPPSNKIIECGSYSNPNLGCSADNNDGAAAYLQSVLWYITGDTAYLNKAISLLNAYPFSILFAFVITFSPTYNDTVDILHFPPLPIAMVPSKLLGVHPNGLELLRLWDTLQPRGLLPTSLSLKVSLLFNTKTINWNLTPI